MAWSSYNQFLQESCGEEILMAGVVNKQSSRVVISIQATIALVTLKNIFVIGCFSKKEISLN